MSSVRVAYYWPDGSHMDAQVWADDTYYVEAIAVARVTAVEALAEAIADMDDLPADIPELDGEGE